MILYAMVCTCRYEMQCYGVRFNDRGYVGHLKFIFGRKLVLTHVTVINKISFLFKKKSKGVTLPLIKFVWFNSSIGYQLISSTARVIIYTKLSQLIQFFWKYKEKIMEVLVQHFWSEASNILLTSSLKIFGVMFHFCLFDILAKVRPVEPHNAYCLL